MTDSKEREDFELFVLSKYPGASLSPRVNNCGITCDDSYANPRIDFAYEAWLARAKKVAVPPVIARALAEWHEDDGAVMWFAWCGREWAGEPAWMGTPNDSDWPGYHTHWVSHPAFPTLPTDTAMAAGGE